MRYFVLVVVLMGCGGGGGSPPNVAGTCTAPDAGCSEGLTCDTTIPMGYCTKACTTAGTTAGCPEASICDQVSGGALSCVKICQVKTDCRADLDCNGVTGSNIKACKPKP